MYDNIPYTEGQWWPPVETVKRRYEIHKAGKPGRNDFMYGIWDSKKEDWARINGTTPFVSYSFASVATVCALWNQNHSDD